MPLRLSTISSAVVFFTVHVYKFTLFSPPVYIVSLVSCLVLLNIFMKSSIRKKITEISGCAGSVHICVVSHVAIGNIPVPSCKGSNACYLQGFFLFFHKVINLLCHMALFLRFHFCWRMYLYLYVESMEGASGIGSEEAARSTRLLSKVFRAC